MANVIYNSYKKGQLDGGIDLVNHTIKVMLVTDVYSPDIDAHDFLDDITGEVVGTGYTAGGKEIENRQTSQDNANDRGEFSGNNVTWTSSSITSRYAILYKSTGVAATSPVIGCLDFGGNKTSTFGDFAIAWHADGIINNN
ncbi:MAG: hypothetical protein KKD77_24240 [Gammaproteobacteria bacterium]|nr:hypothetical protein [Gammaproteobacteria bacterium]